MKPCPCGYLGDATRPCVCAENEIKRYRARLSGPLLDRIDLHLTVAAVALRALGARPGTDSSATVRARVESARARQHARYHSTDGACNATANGRVLLKHVAKDARAMLDDAAEALSLSARAYTRVVKVARTIADLAAVEDIDAAHLAEALRYRPVGGAARR